MLVLKVFAASFMCALSGALMPGPLLTITISQTARRGFVASVLIVLGHALLELCLVFGLIFGLGGLLAQMWVKGGVALLGGLMLLWMGWGMIRDARRVALDLHPSGSEDASDEVVVQKPLYLLIFSGMVVSLSNPYWLLWWATIGLAGLTYFKALVANPALGIGVFYVGHIAGDILWYMAVGAAIAGGRKLLSYKIYSGIVQACGGFLLFLGGSFIYMLASGGLWKINMAAHWMK